MRKIKFLLGVIALMSCGRQHSKKNTDSTSTAELKAFVIEIHGLSVQRDNIETCNQIAQELAVVYSKQADVAFKALPCVKGSSGMSVGFEYHATEPLRKTSFNAPFEPTPDLPNPYSVNFAYKESEKTLCEAEMAQLSKIFTEQTGLIPFPPVCNRYVLRRGTGYGFAPYIFAVGNPKKKLFTDSTSASEECLEKRIQDIKAAGGFALTGFSWFYPTYLSYYAPQPVAFLGCTIWSE